MPPGKAINPSAKEAIFSFRSCIVSTVYNSVTYGCAISRSSKKLGIHQSLARLDVIPYQPKPPLIRHSHHHKRVKCSVPLILSLIESHLDRKSTRLNSSHVSISYAVFCLKKKKKKYRLHSTIQGHFR